MVKKEMPWNREKHNEYNRRWRKEHPEKVNRMNREYRRILKKWVINKLGGKCEKCGQTFDDCVYDFHSSDENDGNHWSKYQNKHELAVTGVRQKILVQWKKEDKIPSSIHLLCANCHRLTHRGHHYGKHL